MYPLYHYHLCIGHPQIEHLPSLNFKEAIPDLSTPTSYSKSSHWTGPYVTLTRWPLLIYSHALNSPMLGPLESLTYRATIMIKYIRYFIQDTNSSRVTSVKNSYQY